MKQPTDSIKTKSRWKRRMPVLIFCIGIAAGILILEAVFGFWNPVRQNTRAFSRNMKEKLASVQDGTTIHLSELTPFEWESVYSFDPYVSKAEMESVLGFSSPYITEGVSESMTTVFFVKGQELVCPVTGYPSNLGFYLDPGHWENQKAFKRIDTMTDEFVVKQDMNIPHLVFEGKTFFGTVEECYDDGTAVVSVDKDREENEDILRSGSQVYISLNEELKAFIRPGDQVRVRYDGYLLETFPLQLGGQMEVTFLGGSRMYCGFLKSLDGTDGVWIDLAEWITDEDTDRIQELQLTENDMPDGYFIYNPEETTQYFSLTEDTVYTFIDWGRDFVDSDEFQEKFVETKELETFGEYLDTYQDFQPGMPFFYELEDGYVKSIVEKPVM